MRHLLLCLVLLVPAFAQAAPLPNVVIILIDDMGYADIGPFGAKGYTTPNLDKMARDGTKFTNFHVAQAVCSASRTALLTGCYSNRVGIHGALGPQSKNGIADSEMTLAQLFKQKGYATCAVGKWHLGHHPQFLPTRHGFDEYLGLPYSNDMWPYHPEMKKNTFPRLSMFDNEKVINADVGPADQAQLTTQYTERAGSFIDRSKDKPFFLYLAHNMCHVPLFVSDKFKGKTDRGLFGDVIEELDWSVGEVMKALDKAGVADNTWVIFTSDNGPWLSYGEHAGSAEPLREGKGTSWEGGVRVPCLMRWPGKIPAGAVNHQMAMTIDVLPTVASLIGGKLPGHTIDGRDLWPVFTSQPGAKNPHDSYAFWYANNQLQSVVSGDGQWKLQLPHIYQTMGNQPKAKGGIPGKYKQVPLKKAELYHVTGDISEATDVADQNPEMLAKMEAIAEQWRAELGDSLTKREGSGNRKPGLVAERVP